MTTNKMLAVLVAVLIGGLSVAGCGDDDSSSGAEGSADSGSATSDSGSSSDSSSSGGGGDSEPIAKPAFVKQGNAICDKTVKDVVAKVLPILEEGEKEKADRESLETQLASEVMIPELQSQVDEIRALGIPAGEEKEVEAFLGEVEKLIEEGEDDPTTLVKRGNSGFNEASKLAKRAGLDSCPYG